MEDNKMDAINVLFMAVSGLLVNRILDALKKVPWLSDEEKTKIAGPLADALAVVFSVVVTWLMSLMAKDNPDVSPLVMTGGTWIWSKVWFEGTTLIRAFRSLALFSGLRNGK
jgi:hypothetical protein